MGILRRIDLPQFGVETLVNFYESRFKSDFNWVQSIPDAQPHRAVRLDADVRDALWHLDDRPVYRTPR